AQLGGEREDVGGEEIARPRRNLPKRTAHVDPAALGLGAGAAQAGAEADALGEFDRLRRRIQKSVRPGLEEKAVLFEGGDPPSDARRALEHEWLGAELGEPLRERETRDAAADDGHAHGSTSRAEAMDLRHQVPGMLRVGQRIDPVSQVEDVARTTGVAFEDLLHAGADFLLREEERRRVEISLHRHLGAESFPRLAERSEERRVGTGWSERVAS